MAYAKDAFGWIGGGKWLKEGKLNEDVFKSFLGDDPAFKLYTATNTDKRKSVQARKTDKKIGRAQNQLVVYLII